MTEARQLGLGPRAKRTPFKPSKSNGVYKGGAKFERDDLAIHVGNAPRCYTLVQSYQVQRNIVGPAAGTKIKMGQEPSEHLLMREKIVKVRVLLMYCTQFYSVHLAFSGRCTVGNYCARSCARRVEPGTQETGRRH